MQLGSRLKKNKNKMEKKKKKKKKKGQPSGVKISKLLTYYQGVFGYLNNHMEVIESTQTKINNRFGLLEDKLETVFTQLDSIIEGLNVVGQATPDELLRKMEKIAVEILSVSRTNINLTKDFGAFEYNSQSTLNAISLLLLDAGLPSNPNEVKALLLGNVVKENTE
jgi:hypothetical protein